MVARYNYSTFENFKATDSTGPESNDFLFRYYLASKDGAVYELLQEAHHTQEDRERARRFIKNNFDAIRIVFIIETKKNN